MMEVATLTAYIKEVDLRAGICADWLGLTDEQAAVWLVRWTKRTAERLKARREATNEYMATDT